MKKRIMNFVIEKAESIMRQQMTIYHLLYGYCCVVQMDIKELCAELGAEAEEQEMLRYLKYKLETIFSNRDMSFARDTNSAVLLFLLPNMVEELEKIPLGQKEYESALNFIAHRRSAGEREDMIAHQLLFHMMDSENSSPYFIPRIGYFCGNRAINLMRKTVEESALEGKTELWTVAEKLNGMYQFLTRKLYGQELAIQKFVMGYAGSLVARASRKNKPAASFLFAGPPGVGKTYLAQLAAEYLEMPFKVFDMSGYTHETAVEGLVGFEKTWKAAVPGVLTDFVRRNPVSVILFDEIEKAGMGVKLLFLQILEGARLHDKYYDMDQSFENVIVIFTTNSGKNLYVDNEDLNLAALDSGEIIEALQEESDQGKKNDNSSKGFPPELCSRFAAGNIIMFNHLQPHNMLEIIRSKMEEISQEFKKKYNLYVVFGEWLPELMLFRMGAGGDARRIASQSVELIQNQIMSLVRGEVEKGTGKLFRHIVFRVIPAEASDDVRELMFSTAEKEERVLLISDHPMCRCHIPGVTVIVPEDESELVETIRESRMEQKNFSLAVVDLGYKMKMGDNTIRVNALGMESVGNECFDILLERTPQLPVYILDNGCYSGEDHRAVIGRGAKGILEQPQSGEDFRRKVEQLLFQNHILNAMKKLNKKRQTIHFKIRSKLCGEKATIELYELSIKAMQRSAASLRSMAKKYGLSEYDRPKNGFDKLIGVDRAKAELLHFRNYMLHMEDYIFEKADRPKGVLLYGPPGTGKTSLARALAAECDAAFFSTTGTHLLDSDRPIQEITDLFQVAYEQAPSVLFVDEVDAIAKERTGYGGTAELCVNALLTQMDGFEDKDPFKPVFVVAASNFNIEQDAGDLRKSKLDPAFVRRFDSRIYIDLPNREHRKQYINLLLAEKQYRQISEDAVENMAQRTRGKSPADIKSILTAVTNKSLDEQKEVNDDLLLDVLDTILYGEEKKRSREDQESTAVHEAGHAFIGWKTGKAPEYITVVSRGDFGGMTSFGDGEDMVYVSKEDALNMICYGMAGRAAEVVYYGEQGINTGISSDLRQATNLALNMICRYGMGSLGLVSIDPKQVLQSPDGAKILEEAKQILDEQMERAVREITAEKDVLDVVVRALVEDGYVSAAGFEKIMAEYGQEKGIFSSGQETRDSARKEHKWYVIFNGEHKGIYDTWQTCYKYVNGVSGAVYRVYKTREEAEKALRTASVTGSRGHIRDKKLLYHLVPLNDLKQILMDGAQPDWEKDGESYVSFGFHAYEPEAVERQKKNPDEKYVYLCIFRETAKDMGYQIYMGKQGEGCPEIMDYETGIQKINWREMEEAVRGEASRSEVRCLGKEPLQAKDIGWIYVPDQASAGFVRELCADVKKKTGKKIPVSTNGRMFMNV